ncbi:MAG TPA: FecR domain-containing protein [Sedimentisphaerales bacterium]|nr:FecR domain-containing protein [Sedimentisphaerales bacterium]
MNEPNAHLDLGELIVLALDGSITAEQFAVLNKRLGCDASARQYYREFLTTCIALQSAVGSAGQLPQDASGGGLDQKLWRELAEEESHAPGAVVGHPGEEDADPDEQAESALPQPSRLPIYAALIAASILLLLMGYIYIVPLHAPAASFVKLVASSGARWAAEAIMEPGQRVPAGRLNLLEGSATIEVRRGAEITLDGRTEVTIESTREVYLAAGTLTSNITADDGLGFVVRTPSAVVTDYGTVFVVTVMPDGGTHVHVLSGRVELAPLGYQDDPEAGQMLAAGQSGEIAPQGDMATSVSPQEEQAATLIVHEAPAAETPETPAGPPKFFDLVDAIGGGDGFGTGRTGVSVSLVDGTIKDGFNFYPDTVSAAGYLTSPAPFVDGVFVPGARPGACIVSSTGTIFRECPATSAAFRADIFNSSEVIDQDGNPVQMRLPGRNWSPAPSLYMHSNSGITFDLDDIRRANPLVEVTMFSCRLGMAWYEGQPEGEAWLDVYILVDGQNRFSRSVSRATDRAEDVRIQLSARDRFLTLIVTDGADGKTVNDHFLFVRPTIRLRTKYRQ